MPYDHDQLLSWYEDSTRIELPAGTTEFGVDEDACVLSLVVRPEHDEAAVQRFLERFPPDAVQVEISTHSWYPLVSRPGAEHE
jgi:hypothetical protein